MVVDGAPGPGTVLTLSHWPASPTPTPLAADLSAQIALRWLAGRHRWRWRGAEAVTIDHLDQDGLVSLYALISPQAALARRPLLEEVARVGDFATGQSRHAARVSFALATLADPERSPLDAARADQSYPQRCAALTEELVDRLPGLVDDPGSHRHLWAEEDAAVTTTQTALSSGDVWIEEVRDLDLAVVHVASGCPVLLATQFMKRRDASWHPVAIHNAIRAMRVMVVQGARIELYYRYESWVRMVSQRPAPRVDLGPLADQLTAEEAPGGPRWLFDGVEAIVPSLRPAGDGFTTIEPDRVRAMVETHLRSSPPSWDPWGTVQEVSRRQRPRQ